MPYDFRTTREDDVLAMEAKRDRQALDALFRKHNRSTYKLLLCRTRNTEDARLLNSDLWGVIAERIGEYNPSYPFGSFVIKQLHTVYYAWLRQKRRDIIRTVPLSNPEMCTLGAAESCSALPVDYGSLDGREEERKYWFLLSLLLSLPRPPHHILVFIYNELLGYPCSQIISHLSGLTLGELADMAEQEYAKQAWLPRGYLRPLFALFKRSLNLPLTELLPEADTRTKQALGPCASQPARLVRLRDLFGSNPQSNCNNWVSRVRKALILAWAGSSVETRSCENGLPPGQ